MPIDVPLWVGEADHGWKGMTLQQGTGAPPPPFRQDEGL